ncbi:glutamate 5-kinase [Alkaliphilus sp. B6464]|uniref:glutamate 5-kinase n=1 Tax=Alkaliphilus sp. B6464 TaxID=2731219 RepID=UPI001BA4F38A|nr:glutamate 5-kinase [Alkaliphilus sp. B6464]QUH19500.1 glutamate 5-kinase [Alkaliphilus sp. B6464]
MLSEVMKKSRKIVIKIGSNTLSNEDGTINHVFIEELCNQVSFLIAEGKQVAIVTSGARIAGISRTNKWSRKEDMHYKQALCAIGQVELMSAYNSHFSQHGIYIGQLLLTREDFFDKTRTLNVRNTLFTLADEGIVPIINENDTVSVEQIKIGDNDTLAAYSASLWNADLLILLSDIDGIYDKNPKDYDDAKLLEQIENIDIMLEKIEIGQSNSFGTGGITTKIEAARIVNRYGIPMILANGKTHDILMKVYNNETKATIFLPEEK